MSATAAADQARLVDLVLREVQGLAQAGNSPWSSVVTEGPPCFGCGVRGQCASVCPQAFEGVLRSGADRIGTTSGIGQLSPDLARYIDHTLLKPEATLDQFQLLCAEAAKHRFCSVCVNPFWVPVCKELLRGHPVKVCTVVGFPLGASSSHTKAFETMRAVADGADEIDMVLNVGAAKSGLWDVVLEDIEAVVGAAPEGVCVKVILETCFLDDAQKVKACEASKRAGADFVKTSTGFGPGGATAADIALMRRTVGASMGVKASGGVRDRETALAMVQAGATRIGASASVAIVDTTAGKKGAAAAPAAAGSGKY